MADALANGQLDPVAFTGPEDPWRSLRRQMDRRRYLRVLARPPVGREKPRRPNPATGVPRASHPLLGPPTSVTRTAANLPNQQDVRAYLRHSADLTMRGGNAAGLVYPLAACGLAEHYLFRRIAGSSSGAIAAAATAAAELGRGAPDPTERPPAPSVQPGFAGLAEIVGWLSGDGAGTQEQHRLARMMQPAQRGRGAFRMLALLLQCGRRPATVVGLRLLTAGVGLLGRWARLLVAGVWLACLLGWLGLTAALVAGNRAGGISLWVAAGASVIMLFGLTVAAAVGTGVAESVALVHFWRSVAPDEQYGLVPGVAVDGAGQRTGWVGRWLDRIAGVPPVDGVPPLATWLTDRLDDLAGIPPGEERHALTFGDLWRGEVAGTGPTRDLAQEHARLAAVEPEHRVIDLALLASDLSGRRPYRFPLPPAELAERSGGTRFLFCESCLTAVLPGRVVTQIVKAAPSTDPDHGCPRHSENVLRELPDPWDLPVALPVRLSFSPPGLARAVPLYSVDSAPANVRTHWFVDGGVTHNVPVNYFDSLLPRWPTFTIDLEPPSPDAPGEPVRVPAQDAAPAPRSWRDPGSASGLLAALLDTVLGWRDSTQSELPGFRGRAALIRRIGTERGAGFLIPQQSVLELAIRGLHAGEALRERFTGTDDDVPGQTQTDRYRWIRLRMALREYRGLSLDIGARLPLYRDLASSYHVPAPLVPWFDPPLPPAERDPLWAEAGSLLTTLRAMSAGGVLDFDVERGAPPTDPQLRIVPPE